MAVTVDELRDALAAAGSAHHDYEQHVLDGERDEHWAGWYAAYLLGRLGDFTTPTQLTAWLTEAEGEDWGAAAAAHVASQVD